MLKCVLLDSNIIIEAYKLGIWEQLIERVEIVVSSVVARQESLFYSKEAGKIPEPINLKHLIQKGQIQELTANPEEIADFLDVFDRTFVFGLHDGETESLALIKSGKTEDAVFCSSDATAIQALTMIGHSQLGISMETLLRKYGLQKRLKHQFKDKFFEDQRAKGFANLLTRQGLKK